jgi:hypothetical protein
MMVMSSAFNFLLMMETREGKQKRCCQLRLVTTGNNTNTSTSAPLFSNSSVRVQAHAPRTSFRKKKLPHSPFFLRVPPPHRPSSTPGRALIRLVCHRAPSTPYFKGPFWATMDEVLPIGCKLQITGPLPIGGLPCPLITTAPVRGLFCSRWGQSQT